MATKPAEKQHDEHGIELTTFTDEEKAKVEAELAARIAADAEAPTE